VWGTGRELHAVLGGLGSVSGSLIAAYVVGYLETMTAYLISPAYRTIPALLLLVFVTNVFCLVYFFLRSGLVTDYTEPQNLFALAVNSPPSERLRGSCGGGPERDQLNVPWHVGHEEGSNHFFIKEDERVPTEYELRRRRERHDLKSMTSYSKLSSKRRSFL